MSLHHVTEQIGGDEIVLHSSESQQDAIAWALANVPEGAEYSVSSGARIHSLVKREGGRSWVETCPRPRGGGA